MSWGSWLPRELPAGACGSPGLRAAVTLPRGVDEEVMLVVDCKSFGGRKEGRRGVCKLGGDGGDFGRFSACLTDGGDDDSADVAPPSTLEGASDGVSMLADERLLQRRGR